MSAPKGATVNTVCLLSHFPAESVPICSPKSKTAAFTLYHHRMEVPIKSRKTQEDLRKVFVHYGWATEVLKTNTSYFRPAEFAEVC